MSCLNGEMFACPSPRNGKVRLTRTACGMKWEIANTDRMPRLRSTRDVGAAKLEARHSPCRDCEAGRENSGWEGITEVGAPKSSKPKIPKAHKVCIDCGAGLIGSVPQRKRCRFCAAAENRRAARGRYARVKEPLF
jgi:hypothetical protein